MGTPCSPACQLACRRRPQSPSGGWTSCPALRMRLSGWLWPCGPGLASEALFGLQPADSIQAMLSRFWCLDMQDVEQNSMMIKVTWQHTILFAVEAAKTAHVSHLASHTV